MLALHAEQCASGKQLPVVRSIMSVTAKDRHWIGHAASIEGR